MTARDTFSYFCEGLHWNIQNWSHLQWIDSVTRWQTIRLISIPTLPWTKWEAMELHVPLNTLPTFSLLKVDSTCHVVNFLRRISMQKQLFFPLLVIVIPSSMASRVCSAPACRRAQSNECHQCSAEAESLLEKVRAVNIKLDSELISIYCWTNLKKCKNKIMQ